MPRRLISTASSIVLASLLSAFEARAGSGQTSSSAVKPPQDFPAGPNRDVVVSACVGCHPVSDVTRHRESRTKWASIVDRMTGEGAQMTDAEAEQIVVYLSVTFGKKVKINEASASVVAETFDFDDKMAEAIVKYRTEHGPFKAWTDLLKVPGVDKRRVEEQSVNLDFSAGAPRASQISSGASRRWMSPRTTR